MCEKTLIIWLKIEDCIRLYYQIKTIKHMKERLANYKIPDDIKYMLLDEVREYYEMSDWVD